MGYNAGAARNSCKVIMAAPAPKPLLVVAFGFDWCTWFVHVLISYNKN